MESVAQSIVSKVGQVLVEELKEIRGVGDKVRHLRDELATMNAVLRVISEAEEGSVNHVVREWKKQVHDLVYDAEDCTDMYERLVLQRTLAADINALLARTTIVSERRARYSIDQVALPRSAEDPISAVRFSAFALRSADHPVVGITEQVNYLAEKIKARSVHGRLEVFSIVGFGGLGKTTLAMELCRHLDADFSRQARISVSRAFHAQKDMKELLVRLLKQILKKKPFDEQIHRMDVEELSRQIKELLEHTRVFGSMDACPDGLESVMHEVLNKCGGLPLVIISIAGLLSSYVSAEAKEMWEVVSRSIGSQMERYPTMKETRQMITLCYDHLPRQLKACMILYLSIFPEDYVTAKDRLLYRWIAEGLVPEILGLTMLEIAEAYLDELIRRNMIQLEKFLRWRGVGCRVHDIILEVLVSKSKESNFVSLVGRQCRGMPHGHDRVRHLSLHGYDHDEQHHGVSGIGTMKVRYIRSLTTFMHYSLSPSKLLDRIAEFKLLRVLDLEDCKALQDKHMRDVCGLYLLRFLSLRGTNVSKIPRKVGNLEHLEILDIKNTGIGMLLPQTVTELSKLERLRSNGWLLPEGLWKMNALREMENGVLKGGDIRVAKEIGELPHLVALSIRIESQHEHAEYLCVLASSLSKTDALQSLYLDPSVLQCLSLNGKISQLPNWISSLTHLRKFQMGWTRLAGDQLFDDLCRLPNLQSVQLTENFYQDPELVARISHNFPVLRILELSSTPTLTKLTFEEGSMGKLETLVLGFDNEEMSIVGIQNLKSLKQVKIRGKKGNLAMECAVEQLRTGSTESNPIKVIVDFS
ncbi:hypothetical protein VPH35_119629 [Triticum aestivum]